MCDAVMICPPTGTRGPDWQAWRAGCASWTTLA